MTVSTLAAAPFVSLTTYRRSGAPVPTPVWVVPDGGDGLLVWTVGTSGKVSRLGHDPRVELARCSRRGAVAAGEPRVAGRAEVVRDDASLAAVQTGLARKYGLQYRLVVLVEAVVGAVRRRHPARVVLRVVDARA